MKITKVSFVAAPAALQRTGVHGWSKIVLDDRWSVDGIAVRRTRHGETVVTFPTRIDSNGVEHPIVRPLDEATRRVVVDAVISHARAGGWIG